MLNISRRVLISAPRDSVQRYLSDLCEIAKYDPRVDSITFTSTAEGSSVCEASVEGHFLGLPWHGTFRFEMMRDGGYRAAMLGGSLRRMECRMTLRPVTGGTLLEREESYGFSFLMSPLKPFLRRSIDRTLEGGLGLVKEGAERLNRQIQLQRLEA